MIRMVFLSGSGIVVGGLLAARHVGDCLVTIAVAGDFIADDPISLPPQELANTAPIGPELPKVRFTVGAIAVEDKHTISFQVEGIASHRQTPRLSRGMAREGGDRANGCSSGKMNPR